MMGAAFCQKGGGEDSKHTSSDCGITGGNWRGGDPTGKVLLQGDVRGKELGDKKE